MSSQLTETELSPVKSASEDRAYRRSKFVRTSSLERIKKFNSFICSQNFYILPALLTWLRTSHTIAQSTIEKVILTTKAVFASVFKVKMFAFIIHDVVNLICAQIQKRLFTTVVYLTVAAVFSQLIVCLYLLTSVIIPAGLIFLITCLYLISHINLQCLNYFLAQKEKDKMATSDKVKMPRLSRKDILGKRTISNFNLF